MFSNFRGRLTRTRIAYALMSPRSSRRSRIAEKRKQLYTLMHFLHLPTRFARKNEFFRGGPHIKCSSLYHTWWGCSAATADEAAPTQAASSAGCALAMRFLSRWEEDILPISAFKTSHFKGLLNLQFKEIGAIELYDKRILAKLGEKIKLTESTKLIGHRNHFKISRIFQPGKRR